MANFALAKTINRTQAIWLESKLNKTPDAFGRWARNDASYAVSVYWERFLNAYT